MTKPIATLLQNIIAPDQNQNWKFHLLNAWPTIVSSLATKVRLEKVYDDTLILTVADSCWLHELYMLTPVLLATINQHLDKPRIKKLRLQHIDFRTPLPVQSKEQKVIRKRFTHYELAPREQGALQKIHDPALKTALHRFLIRCYQENT